ncbi:hypothetical protein HPP92_005329 [Vanilla planifolia]|uniref:Uncharacterized protein n=1 Tax=Vanilla planifolia TaxID=51239 RepID=A0A835RGY6_VANPL|nr:hypothetical protein HPP92_005329 [Vanilla planifolia]
MKHSASTTRDSETVNASAAVEPEVVEQKRRRELEKRRAEESEAADLKSRPREGRKDREGSKGVEEESEGRSGRRRKWQWPRLRRRDFIWMRMSENDESMTVRTAWRCAGEREENQRRTVAREFEVVIEEKKRRGEEANDAGGERNEKISQVRPGCQMA